MKLPKFSSFLAKLKKVRFRKPTPATLKSFIKKRRITWKSMLRAGIICIAAFLIFSAGLFAWFYKDLPRPGELVSRPTEESTILYDRNGKQIYDISGDERRILLTKDEIPQNIKDATIAIEDPNFYKHYGVDFRGLARAVIYMGKRGGGSTITQQYVKNAILSPKRSPIRKIKELIISLQIEFLYSKDEILTMYLNEIPYGGNIYGVEAASQTFYGKSAKEGLTTAQVATLAGIPQSPTRYSPYGSHMDRLMARKNRVIDAMVKNNTISEDEGVKAKAVKPLEAKDFAQKQENFPAPHFVMYVREQLVQKYGEEMVQRGGLRVTTTLDLATQDKADQAFDEQASKTLPKVKADNAALTAIDPKTGQILAMIGSVDYFDRENSGNFNVATALRQPGSSIKPLVYGNLFNDAWAPSSVMWDVETDFNNYKPQNFNGRFHGPLTIRKSLGNSFNIPAVKALQLQGMKSFFAWSKELGITTFEGKEDRFGLSVALGGGEVKLVDIVSAYSAFANNGERHPLTAILKIQDSRGKVLEEWKAKGKQVMKPEIAYQISHILSDNEAKRPTFSSLLNVLGVNGKTVASKTGTTNNYKDAWTIGYTPSIAVGVWVGNNDGSEMDRGGGSTAAAPIWDAFLEKYLKDKQNEPFNRPSGIQDIEVDFLSGKLPTSASGQRVRDIIASWQAPKGHDDVHKIVKVCRSNGKLATDQTPASEIEERVYTQVRSELPTNPAWENPVQAYARGAKLITDAAPTEKCDITSQDATISITSPGDNETVRGIFTISADVDFPPNGSGTVEFSIGNKSVGTDDTAPFAITLDAGTLTPGSHIVTATVTTNFGTSASNQITIIVGQDTTPPGPVTNMILAPGTTKGTSLANWKNPNDSDLASVTFYVSQSSGVRGAYNSLVAATPDSNQSATITGLVSGVVNYITALTTDKTGNVSTSTVQYSVIPL